MKIDMNTPALFLSNGTLLSSDMEEPHMSHLQLQRVAQMLNQAKQTTVPCTVKGRIVEEHAEDEFIVSFNDKLEIAIPRARTTFVLICPDSVLR